MADTVMVLSANQWGVHTTAPVLEARMWLGTERKTGGKAASATTHTERDGLKQKPALPRFSCFAREA